MGFRIALFVAFLTAMIANAVEAEWVPANEGRERRESDKYITAVGTKDNLEPVKASDIFRALLKGKEIRLKYAEVQEDLNFSREIKQDVYFLSTTFSGDVGFQRATFLGNVNFSGATFLKDAHFGWTKFHKETKFKGVTFRGRAGFVEAEFGDKVDFSIRNVYDCSTFTKFLGDAVFGRCHFRSQADFGKARFSELAMYGGTTFHENANFKTATFEGIAGFRGVTFSGQTDFSMCCFEERSVFINCKYSVDSIMIFREVTGFSTMLMEWESDAASDLAKSPDETTQRGLKGHLEYDATFYTALIRNYQDMGWSKQGDDVYYTYRVEKRDWEFKERLLFSVAAEAHSDLKSGAVPEGLRKSFTENEISLSDRTDLSVKQAGVKWRITDGNMVYIIEKEKEKLNIYKGGITPLYKRIVEYIMLDSTFGYGVKPWNMFRSFLLLWIPFSLYYALCLHSKRSSDAFRFWRAFYDKLWRVSWGLLHSLDNITPGVDLRSLNSLERRQCQFNEGSSWITWVQRIQTFLGWYLLALFFIMFGKIWIR